MGNILQFIIGDILWQVTVMASLMQAWQLKEEITATVESFTLKKNTDYGYQKIPFPCCKLYLVHRNHILNM
jgi:hypothetical protein